MVLKKMSWRHLIIIKNLPNKDINVKFQLEYCYMTGIGTEINEKGFELYNEAAGKKDGDIQNILELPHDKISIIKLQVMIIKLRYIN